MDGMYYVKKDLLFFCERSKQVICASCMCVKRTELSSLKESVMNGKRKERDWKMYTDQTVLLLDEQTKEARRRRGKRSQDIVGDQSGDLRVARTSSCGPELERGPSVCRVAPLVCLDTDIKPRQILHHAQETAPQAHERRERNREDPCNRSQIPGLAHVAPWRNASRMTQGLSWRGVRKAGPCCQAVGRTSSSLHHGGSCKVWRRAPVSASGRGRLEIHLVDLFSVSHGRE